MRVTRSQRPVRQVYSSSRALEEQNESGSGRNTTTWKRMPYAASEKLERSSQRASSCDHPYSWDRNEVGLKSRDHAWSTHSSVLWEMAAPALRVALTEVRAWIIRITAVQVFFTFPRSIHLKTLKRMVRILTVVCRRNHVVSTKTWTTGMTPMPWERLCSNESTRDKMPSFREDRYDDVTENEYTRNMAYLPVISIFLLVKLLVKRRITGSNNLPSICNISSLIAGIFPNTSKLYQIITGPIIYQQNTKFFNSYCWYYSKYQQIISNNYWFAPTSNKFNVWYDETLSAKPYIYIRLARWAVRCDIADFHCFITFFNHRKGKNKSTYKRNRFRRLISQQHSSHRHSMRRPSPASMWYLWKIS